jgi:hypothetical protein
MVIRIINLTGFIVFLISMVGCSVSSDILRSTPKVDNIVIETWPLRTDDFDIFVKPNNDFIINRTSKVLVTMEQEVFSENMKNENQSFYVAIRLKIEKSVLWNPSLVNLLYRGKAVSISKIDYVNLLVLDGNCNTMASHEIDSIELIKNDYVCLKIEYDIPQINPVEKFELKLDGIIINSEKMSPVIFEFEGKNKKIETRN